MLSGRIKWFSAEKNFGFIVPDAGGADIFLHGSALDAAGIDIEPEEGDKVTFDLTENPKHKGKPCAVNLTLVPG